MTNGKLISGYVKQGFEAVQEAFLKNFENRNALGAACCVYYKDEKVVDLWGGAYSSFKQHLQPLMMPHYFSISLDSLQVCES
jgi:hypothetical protein